jgi:hypothetical protein
MYQERSIALCLPDECSNPRDARTMGNDFTHKALMHTWLEVGNPPVACDV